MAEDHKTHEKPKTIVSNLCMDALTMAKLPPLCSSHSNPPSPDGLRKSSSVRRHNCLCSPTTHAGSFRCRYHRNHGGSGGGLTRSSMSVGSKLSELAEKQDVMCENVPHINRLVSAQGQGS